MKKMILAIVLLSVTLNGQERADLTTAISKVVPVSTSTSLTKAYVKTLILDWDAALIVIRLKYCNTDNTICSTELAEFTYDNSTATTFMIALNKANLTSNSLNKRIIDRLIADGKISGTSAGSPQ